MILLSATPSQEPDTHAITYLNERVNLFTIDLLKQQAKINHSNNFIVSPQSIYSGLSMSYIASEGKTRKELAEVFHFPKNNQMVLENLDLLQQELYEANKNSKNTIKFANSLWFDDKNADFKQSFLQVIKKFSSVEKVNFQNKSQVLKKINQWISQNTNGQFTQSLKEKEIKSNNQSGNLDETSHILANAVYFKADWASRFDKQATQKRPFFLDPSTQMNIAMMHQKSELLYAEDQQFQFLQIPYLGKQYSMQIILPKKQSSIKEMVNLLNKDVISGLKLRLYRPIVDVLLPKFEMRSQLKLQNLLSQMGIKDAFNKEQANFNGMLHPNFNGMLHPNLKAQRTYLSEVSHDAWIEVEEQGTKAAATTRTTHFFLGL